MEPDEKKCPFCAETIKAAAIVCKHCGKSLDKADAPIWSSGTSQPTKQPTPTTPLHSTTQSKKKIGCLKISLYIVVALFALAIINGILRNVSPEYARLQDERQAQRQKEEAEQAATRNAERSAADQVRADAEKTKHEAEQRLVAATPKTQTDFVNSILTAREQFGSLKNEIQQEKVRGSRAANIKNILGGYAVENWIGTVNDVSTNSDGLGILSIIINVRPEIAIKTHNNALSDVGSNTLVKKTSPVYDQLGELAKNDRVVFSGQFIPDSRDFIKESSLTMSGSMDEPAYIIRFTAVKKYEEKP